MAPHQPGSPSDLAAVVLAAGRSTRMGAFKPLLPFGSATTVLGHVVAGLRAAGIGRVHVVIGHRGDEVAPAAARLGVSVAINPDVDRGMYSSVQVGIASLPPSVHGCLLLPVDIPLVRSATFVRILATAVATKAIIVHPTFRGERAHPPYLDAALFDEIRSDAPAGGLRSLLAAHDAGAREIPVFDRGCTRDMDYPADYRSLIAALASHRFPDADECDAMLDVADTAAPVRAHCRAVAALAETLARRLAVAGLRLDLDLIRAGALVHDIAKGQSHHDKAGAAMLRAFGFPEVAAIVARHMELGFDGETLDEAAVVYLADKLVAGERWVTLAQRFAPGFARFRDDPAALAGARRRFAEAETVFEAMVQRIAAARRLAPAHSSQKTVALTGTVAS